MRTHDPAERVAVLVPRRFFYEHPLLRITLLDLRQGELLLFVVHTIYEAVEGKKSQASM
jgi:hypothetical protein